MYLRISHPLTDRRGQGADLVEETREGQAEDQAFVVVADRGEHYRADADGKRIEKPVRAAHELACAALGVAAIQPAQRAVIPDVGVDIVARFQDRNQEGKSESVPYWWKKAISRKTSCLSLFLQNSECVISILKMLYPVSLL